MKNNSTTDCQIVNIKTGEVVSPIISLAQSKREKLYQGCFVSGQQEKHLIKALSPGAYRLSGLLRSYMCKGNWITITQKLIKKELGLSNKSVIKYMSELKRLDVIRGDYGTYMYNPRIAINGGSKILKEAVEDYHRILWVAKGER